MKPFKRTDRIASEIRSALAMLIVSEIEDPRGRMGVVTGVKVTADMSLCRVYVRSIQGDEQGKAELLAGLQKSSAFLRRELAHRVSMLRMPRLEFFYDDVPDQAARVEELLFRLPKPAEGAGGEPPKPVKVPAIRVPRAARETGVVVRPKPAKEPRTMRPTTLKESKTRAPKPAETTENE
jgi:ribosome-binding factor A